MDVPTITSKRRAFDPLALVGLLATLLLHVGLFGGAFYYAHASAASVAPAEQYVVARLVRLGRKRERKRLPSKVVPPRPKAAPEKTVDYSADASDKPVQRKPEPKETSKDLQDRLRASLDKAKLLQQAEEAIEAEGSEHGSASGTASTASSGDEYITRVADLWNRTWSLPSIIPKDEAQSLSALVVVMIDKAGNIQQPIQFDRASGNAHFDASIQAAWARIKQLPLPPPDRLASILANGLALKLTWKGLQ